jgi:hypothetical protein
MDVDAKKQINFHFSILPISAKKALDFFAAEGRHDKQNCYRSGIVRSEIFL